MNPKSTLNCLGGVLFFISYPINILFWIYVLRYVKAPDFIYLLFWVNQFFNIITVVIAKTAESIAKGL